MYGLIHGWSCWFHTPPQLMIQLIVIDWSLVMPMINHQIVVVRSQPVAFGLNENAGNSINPVNDSALALQVANSSIQWTIVPLHFKLQHWNDLFLRHLLENIFRQLVRTPCHCVLVAVSSFGPLVFWRAPKRPRALCCLELHRTPQLGWSSQGHGDELLQGNAAERTLVFYLGHGFSG